jgi:phosphoribosylaminoimidazole-succinocarboxamide synthase
VVPEMTPEKVESISERYIELYEQITGEKFVKPDAGNVLARVENAINNELTQL